MLIRILPIKYISLNLLQKFCKELEASINVRCKILPQIKYIDSAFNALRRQYDASKIIDIIASTNEGKFIDKSIPTIGITEEDIYYKGLNFVFSIEEPENACSVISIARLKPEFYDQKPNNMILIDRIVKEAMHEIGHHIGLNHCKHIFCIMSPSPSAKDIDIKRREFCRNCKINMAMKGINIDL